jgi:hypothetical protein
MTNEQAEEAGFFVGALTRVILGVGVGYTGIWLALSGAYHGDYTRVLAGCAMMAGGKYFCN